MSEIPTYVLERTFDAPREAVWRAWTDAELVSHWYGPNVETIIHELDARPGGCWCLEMKWGENSNYQKSEFTEVESPERLVSLMSVTDADWNTVSNPMMPDWPRFLRTEVVLQELGDQTKMRFTWTPHEASEAEIACFEQAVGNMGKGWEMGMDLLAKQLAEI